MDFSKLPKLSKTGEAQPPAADPTNADIQNPMPIPAEQARPAQPAVGMAEAWISIAIGVLLLLVFPSTIKYIHSPADFEQNYPVYDAQNNQIPYAKSAFFWSDLGITVFALALIVEGIILGIARKVGPLYFAFWVTVMAAVFNVGVIVHVYPIVGFHIICGVGVAVLVYMAMTQWRLIRILGRAHNHREPAG
jgi:hypothetical protein